MREPFTLSRAHVAATDWQTLKRELFSYTGNEHEASSILRRLESLGTDPSIDHYEMIPSPNPNPNVYPGSAESIWSVRAVPGERPPPPKRRGE